MGPVQSSYPLCLLSLITLGCGQHPNLEEMLEATLSSTTTTLPDTAVPSAPIIVSPVSNPYYSHETTFTVTGTCEPLATVQLTGDDTKITTCSQLGAFSFILYENIDAQYVYQIKQTDKSSNASSTTTFIWYRTLVSPPFVTSPTSSPTYSNQNSLNISGQCETGNTVLLSGESTQNFTCASSAYSFSVSASVDGSHSYSLIQENASGDNSPAVTQVWIRDTVAPSAPTVTSPAASPHISSGSSLTLSGACESLATVTISGDSSGTIVCESSSYSLTVNQSSDGTYNFSLVQTDRAGNQSTSTNFQWIRDTSIPATPVLSSPASDPHYSNANDVTIAGSCEAGFDVLLNGDSTQSQTCVGGAFSFTASKTADSTYSYSASQRNPNTMISSATAGVIWIRDTVAPSSPTIISPTISPYYSSGNLTLTGACESGTTVYLSGADSQNTSCVDSNYSFIVSQSVDGTYNFSLTQRDRSGNLSTATAQSWVRDSSIPANPTVTTPASSPYKSNSSTLTISGGCVTGYTVTLGGDVVQGEVLSPAGSLTQICASSTYSYSVSKASDGTFNFSVKQTSLSSVDSGSVGLQWVLDMTAPNTTLTLTPSDPNLGKTATFNFSSTETGSFACSLDGGTYTTCTSPYTLPNVSNASHTFQVRATDLVNNTDATPASYTWTQMSADTLALYHLDSADPTLDSGGYSAPYQNNLTDSGTTNNALGKFSQARSFNGSNQYLSASHNASLAQASLKMTIEAFVQLSSLPADRYAVISKNGASGQYGWELGIKKQGANYRLYFIGSLDGVAVTEITGSNFGTVLENAILAGPIHVAATWDQGSVKLYMDGAQVGSGIIGSGIVSLFNNSSTGVQIGASNGTKLFSGSMDEVRISQVVRWTGAFTAPTSAYIAD